MKPVVKATDIFTDSTSVNVLFLFLVLSFDNRVWKNVPDCVHTSANSCDVTSTKAESTDDCIMLRVQAERRGLISRAVEACSKHGKKPALPRKLRFEV